MENDKIEACYMCDNARINENLSDENDYSSVCVNNNNNNNNNNYRIMVTSGWGQPVSIEFEKLFDNGRWGTVCKYYPKHCPNCGREIIEFKKQEVI